MFAEYLSLTAFAVVAVVRLVVLARAALRSELPA